MSGRHRAILFRAALVLVAGGFAPSVSALANRVFVSARSGNNANSCDNIATPCQTFTGAVAQLNPGGEAIVLDSGGYGAVTITQSLTIEAPPGVTAFVHPSVGIAITINAGATDVVILRGLTLHGGPNAGIRANTVGTLAVENCAISGFATQGILMLSSGSLYVKNTDVRNNLEGIAINNSAGTLLASIDHCHLDENVNSGFIANTVSPGASATAATNTSSNGNGWGWSMIGSGPAILHLEFCSGSHNINDGVSSNTPNASSDILLSNCLFSYNGHYGVRRTNVGDIQSRGNNSLTANGLAPTIGMIGSFSPM